MRTIPASYFRYIRGETGISPWSLLSPLGWLAGSVSSGRNFFYDHGITVSREPSIPVISVGNITHGGTNKTPFVEMLSRLFLEAGIHPGIVMRGYGRKGKDILFADDCERSRDLLGDEALLLSGRLEGVPIVVSADRTAGVECLSRRGVDLAIADDGFQHRRMGRDVDVVLVDATCPFGNGKMMPAGMLREKADSLERAHMVVISKADQVTPDRLDEIRERILSVTGKEPFLSNLTLSGWSRFSEGVDLLRDSGPPPSPVAAFSAIGNPASFNLFLQKLGFQPVIHEAFRDHHIFSVAELQAVCEKALVRGARSLICTEKDIFNLPAEWLPGVPVYIPRVCASVRNMNSFLSKLSDCLRPKIVVSSNGHGEDAIGSLLASRLKKEFPLSEISGFPLVGRGREYGARGVAVLSPPSETPSGGVVKYRLQDLMRDIRSGLLRHISAQASAWSGLRGRIRTVVCVGDVYLFLHTLWGQGVMPVLLATAKSVRLHGHWRLERILLKIRVRKVFTRDSETAMELAEKNIDAVYSGNPIMDLAGGTDNGYGKKPVKLAGNQVLFLPGSRERAYDDLALLLDAAALMENEAACSFVMAVAPTLDVDRLLEKAPSWEFTSGDVICSRNGEHSVKLFFGDVHEAALGSDILIGLGGTANQICAGLGVPVVSIDEKGKRVQKKLLGEAESLVPPDPFLLAREALSILGDPVRRETMARAGKERMGTGGAVEGVVGYASQVLGWRKRHEVFRVFSDFAAMKGDIEG
jgi:tetraacyldisaccharide 4'-kinase